MPGRTTDRRFAWRHTGRGGAAVLAVASLCSVAAAQMTTASAARPAFAAYGNLDCNGYSPSQRPLKPIGSVCAEVHGGSDQGNLEDNGHYIGHDEPLIQFFSDQRGSGNTVTWNETLPHDPAAAPTVSTPLNDVTHFFETTIALWFSMDLCDPNSYPQLPCTPNSDANAPHGRYPGAGNAFLEVQFYPPGFAPFVDSISCDNRHWCAALTIDSLECTAGFASCNGNCIEPINFAWIQSDGVPTGPPSPQQADLNTFSPNQQTLLMNPGDRIQTQIFDNHRAGALETVITDITTGRRGFMIASAANGFQNTSIVDCSGTPFSFQPEYSTADPNNDGSWAAANIDTAYEVGHFIPCSSLERKQTLHLGPGVTDVAYNECVSAYETATRPDSARRGEPGDGPCYQRGDRHGALSSAPDEVTGCIGGDLDYDGTSYWRDWPDSTTPDQFPSPLDQFQPVTAGAARYPQMEFITDSPASNPRCSDATLNTECVVPPPQAPGAFYPYWTLAQTTAGCVWEFGQMSNGNTYGGDAQWGSPTIFPNNFIQDAGPIMPNPVC
jgi:hypothetical protein